MVNTRGGEQKTEIKPTQTWARRWLSEERLAPYLADCHGDITAALSLYEWNVALAQVLMRDIAHFEVALRNAYNRFMCERWDGQAHWLLDDESPVRKPLMRESRSGLLDANRVNRKTIDGVVDELPPNFSIGSMISRLTLGFWVHLTDRVREVSLWRTHLYLSWPRGTNRSALQRRLNGILRVRNRVAHAERLFNPKEAVLSPLNADADAIDLLRDLCPEAAEYLYKDAEDVSVARFCEEHPAPVPVCL